MPCASTDIIILTRWTLISILSIFPSSPSPSSFLVDAPSQPHRTESIYLCVCVCIETLIFDPTQFYCPKFSLINPQIKEEKESTKSSRSPPDRRKVTEKVLIFPFLGFNIGFHFSTVILESWSSNFVVESKSHFFFLFYYLKKLIFRNYWVNEWNSWFVHHTVM